MTSPSAEDRAPVIQADRDAAADMQRWRAGGHTGAEEAFRDGLLDLNYTVQAFARHRIAFEAAAIERAAQVCLQVSGLIGAGAGSSIDSALREAAQSIRALAGGEAASDG